MRFNIDFIGRKGIWFSISGVIIALGLIVILWQGLNFGIEFKGGNLFDVKFKEAPSVAEVRKVLTPLELGASGIQPIGAGKELLIKTDRLSREKQNQVVAALKKEFKVADAGITDVGPGWGSQVTNGAIKALIGSLIVLLLYISIRFEYKMAVAAVAALFHDLLIVIGIYAMVGAGHNLFARIGLTVFPTEITPNTVAAILTILGFSLYDTIVIFHRIKENAPAIGKRTYSKMTNDSINQVLFRSINTSLVAVIPPVALLIAGGQTLKDFAFALVVGLISGAYSSIFIASPILAFWKELEPRYKILRERYGALPAPEVSPPAGALAPGAPTAERVEAEGVERPTPPPTAAPKPRVSKKRRKRRRR